jgi:hypothetical protein
MNEQEDRPAGEKRQDVIATFERLLDEYKEGKISREQAAATIVNVIDALRNKEEDDDDQWYNDVLYLLAILGL